MIELQTLVVFFQNFGYLAVFGILLLCGFGLPIPEDISIIAGGIISGLGFTNLYIMLGVCFGGVLAGDLIIFSAGKKFGMQLLQKKLFKKIITEKRFCVAQNWFAKYGKLLIFAARFMPGLRTPIFATAGITRVVSFPAFLFIDGFAALISVPAWLYVGFHFAHNREQLLQWVSDSHLVLGIIIIVFVAILVIKTKIHRRVEEAEKNCTLKIN
jgi:membrane protein DedA with SNARE-associated domain